MQRAYCPSVARLLPSVSRVLFKHCLLRAGATFAVEDKFCTILTTDDKGAEISGEDQLSPDTGDIVIRDVYGGLQEVAADAAGAWQKIGPRVYDFKNVKNLATYRALGAKGLWSYVKNLEGRP